MRSVREAFDEFRTRLEITQTEQDDAARRQRSVRECIQESFEVSRDFLTGSYARDTKTKPLQDVDVFVVLGTSERKRREKSPAEILEDFRACLAAKYGHGNVQPDRHCVTVEFEKRNKTETQDGRILSIDVVPAFDIGKCFEIPANSFEWMKTDPEIHAEQATKKNKALDGGWIPLVKMIKGWNREASKPIVPSFLIEVMALDLVDGPFNNYADETRRFFAAAADSIERSWPDPAGVGPSVSNEMTAFMISGAKAKLREAEKLAARAFRAEQQGQAGEALSLWNAIFGTYFPKS